MIRRVMCKKLLVRRLAVTGAVLFFGALVVLVGIRIHHGAVRIVGLGKIDDDSFKCLAPSDTLGYAFRPNCDTNFQRADGRTIRIKYNSRGFRDRDYPKKTRRRHRVLIIGDSQMVAAGVPEDKTFPRQLEAAWRRHGYDIEVVNGAVIGSSIIQVYLSLAGAIEAYRPDGIVLGTGVSGNLIAKLFHQRPFLDANPSNGRPLRIRNMNFHELLFDVPGIFEWGSNGIQAGLNRRTFLELAGNCRRSWKCALNPLGSDADCMLGEYFSLLKLVRDRSLESGAKFLFLPYGLDFENTVSSGAWNLPWFLRLAAWITPKVTVSKEEWMATLVRDGIPAMVLDYSMLVLRAGEGFPGDDVHLSEDIFEKLAMRYGGEIAEALSISKK